jgi:glutathione S-transferase
VGREFSLGDIAVGTVIGYLAVRWPDYDWQSQHPNLAAFSARIEQRPSFKGSVPVPQKISDKVM